MNNLKVGFFLATRQLRRSSIWATTLIVLVMALTFLNLVLVSGILVGLIEGIRIAYEEEYSGNILITQYTNKQYIEQSQSIIKTLEGIPEIEAFSARYKEGGTMEAGFKEKTNQADVPNRVSATLIGIDPEEEDKTTNLSSLIIAGEYLERGDERFVIVGADLLEKYSRFVGAGADFLLFLKDADVGSEVRIAVNGIEKDVIIKGIIQSKVDQVSTRVYFSDREFRKIIGRSNLNVDEIAIKLYDREDANRVKRILLATGAGEFGMIQTSEESQGSFFNDIKRTFNILGSAIGSIGLAVASITIFIVIFINAISRRKYIGIMKGIGINGRAIEISYVLQSIAYAVIGTLLGLTLLYGVLVPFFMKNPINFPFSDGILVAPVGQTAIRILLLFITTLTAGYIPARIIIRKNTLDSILGR